MLLDVSRLKKEPGASLETEMVADGTVLEQVPDVVKAEGQLTTRIKGSNSNGLLVFNFEVEMKVHLRCSRCLEGYPIRRRVCFAEAFREKPGAAEMSLEEKYHGDVNFFEGEEIELEEVVRQNLLAALPMKPVCASDCVGLCSSCGQNLNREQCGCSSDAIDPRLAALAQLLEQGDEE